ncbi:hypothetical protein COW36_16855 [bacterium (Candidatus Blackallbacteria) CG17_big_fil_post_rev_8_21_14_2_50_48_46]|uniref:Uncharacterized protein n=1 Tax=bacterium (Candidatus Blackallbacteria) CG17_big_fil_post_rev_8_21_14_2_50_48_46 TaxID=2014261 RepID=A0A2M7G1F7_9BACT|nr:MAG: hypothetical protein COW64_22355 [bacterium (Candidatus Blackallbacteria) CG18_big_fil_WC_8_21_14_2_50_49_26]PIW15546.1 MAG: hypothetical protein COW36_16855 [bacterium (Candidatus Blackallbacteria) CG17_big_fil_post_rev_8_21_14_2_50_48_46]PIW50288.1 MAG: hypothetical protein COW20_03120 [bacterium (Candidatus Blackallbacteria) CG13_big_fil_rev_8_21_14_2_50_49_14]
MNSVISEDVSNLAYLGWVLQESGFETAFIEADAHPEQPYEQLLVHSRQDKQGQPVTVRLLFAEDVLRAIYRQAGQDIPESHSAMLQFTIWLPELRQFPAERMAELDQLLNALNQQTSYGVFAFNSLDGIHFRHTLAVPQEDPDARLVAEVISGLAFQSLRFQPHLQALAKGQAPLATILKKVQSQAGDSHAHH